MKRFSFVLACFLLVPLIVNAGWQDREGNPQPDTPDKKSIGDFGAWLILTGKEDEAFKNWNTPSEGVYLDTEDKFKRNEFVSALVIFSGCGEDDKGNCNLAVKFKIFQPDGRVYSDMPMQEAWIDKPSPGRALQMSYGYMKVRIEDDEPLGTYEITVDVIDANSGKVIRLSSKFQVSE